jgi:hypothetical protein
MLEYEAHKDLFEFWKEPQNALDKHNKLGYGSTNAWHCFGGHKIYCSNN